MILVNVIGNGMVTNTIHKAVWLLLCQGVRRIWVHIILPLLRNTSICIRRPFLPISYSKSPGELLLSKTERWFSSGRREVDCGQGYFIQGFMQNRRTGFRFTGHWRLLFLGRDSGAVKCGVKRQLRRPPPPPTASANIHHELNRKVSN